MGGDLEADHGIHGHLHSQELLLCEERTFKQDRLRQADDVRQTRQLHLMQQELGIMRQHLFPAERCPDFNKTSP